MNIINNSHKISNSDFQFMKEKLLFKNSLVPTYELVADNKQSLPNSFFSVRTDPAESGIIAPMNVTGE